MTDVRALLHDLADRAPSGHGASTADRVVARDDDLRRRRNGWLVGVAALVGVVVTAPVVVRGLDADTADPATAISDVETVPGLGLYDLPPRGSLAGDDGLLAQALAASWDDGSGEAGIDPPTESRRVSYIGEVPGGQTWALVLGRVDAQTWFTWFTDTTPSDGVTWERASGPDRAFPDTPIALLDRAGDQGPLVVVAAPEDEVRLPSTGTSGVAPPGDYAAVETTDGVAVAEVPSPEYPRFSIGFQVVRDGLVVYEQPPQSFDSTDGLGPQAVVVPSPDAPPDDEYGQRMTDCLAPLGFDVTVSGDGFSSRTPPEDEQAFDAAVAACQVSTGYA